MKPELLLVAVSGLVVLPRVSYSSAATTSQKLSLECLLPFFPHNIPNSALPLAVPTWGFGPKEGQVWEAPAVPEHGAWQQLPLRGRVLTL